MLGLRHTINSLSGWVIMHSTHSMTISSSSSWDSNSSLHREIPKGKAVMYLTHKTQAAITMVLSSQSGSSSSSGGIGRPHIHSIRQAHCTSESKQRQTGYISSWLHPCQIGIWKESWLKLPLKALKPKWSLAVWLARNWAMHTQVSMLLMHTQVSMLLVRREPAIMRVKHRLYWYSPDSYIFYLAEKRAIP